MNKKKFYNSLKGTSETRNGKLKKTVSKDRWNLAHVSEEEFWEEYTTDSLKARSTERYRKKAEALLELWSTYLDLNKNTNILQIGCGPEDIINHFKTVKKYSIDPLANFYKKRFKFDYEASNLKNARGEQIPYPDKFFDIVILTNVLDHTESPERVLSEIKRVLKDDGIFYFENYIFQKNFLRIAAIWGLLKKTFTKQIFNIHHPFMFTRDDVKILLGSNFTILEEDCGKEIGAHKNIESLVKSFKTEKKFNIKLLSKFGLYGSINYMCVCKKDNAI